MKTVQSTIRDARVDAGVLGEEIATVVGIQGRYFSNDYRRTIHLIKSLGTLSAQGRELDRTCMGSHSDDDSPLPTTSCMMLDNVS